MTDPQQVWTDVRFWALAIEESRRTVLCSPDLESRLKMHIAAAGATGQFTVIADRWMPEGTVYVIDPNAIEAATRQALARPIIFGPEP